MFALGILLYIKRAPKGANLNQQGSVV
jgi:hypothetical protein